MDECSLYEFDIEPSEDDERLDAYLNEQFADLSRSYISKVIKNGGCLVNDVIVTKAGFRLSVRPPRAQHGIQFPVMVAEIARVPRRRDVLEDVSVPVDLEDARDMREVDGVFARARALHVPHHRIERSFHHDAGNLLFGMRDHRCACDQNGCHQSLHVFSP